VRDTRITIAFVPPFSKNCFRAFWRALVLFGQPKRRKYSSPLLTATGILTGPRDALPINAATVSRRAAIGCPPDNPSTTKIPLLTRSDNQHTAINNSLRYSNLAGATTLCRIDKLIRIETDHVGTPLQGTRTIFPDLTGVRVLRPLKRHSIEYQACFVHGFFGI